MIWNMNSQILKLVYDRNNSSIYQNTNEHGSYLYQTEAQQN